MCVDVDDISALRVKDFLSSEFTLTSCVQVLLTPFVQVLVAMTMKIRAASLC